MTGTNYMTQNIIMEDEKLCILANQAYEDGYDGYFEDIMTNILNDNKIKNLPCALNNKSYFCLKNSNDDNEQITNYVITLLNQALSISPSNYKSLWLLGKIYYDNKMYTSSIDQFLKAVEANPNIISLNNTGVVFHHLKQYTESEKYFKKAVEESNNMIAIYNFTLENIINQNYSFAKQLLLKLLPCEDIDYIDIGRLYYLLKDYQIVCNLYEKEWNDVLPNPIDLGIYLFSLKKTNQLDKYNFVQNQTIESSLKFINDIEDDMTSEAYLENLNNIRSVIEQINAGYVPSVYLEPIMIDACYLYHCLVHNNDML